MIDLFANILTIQGELLHDSLSLDPFFFFFNVPAPLLTVHPTRPERTFEVLFLST